MLDAGLRVAEACALLWADVEMRQGQIHVRHGKGDRARVVPVTWDMLRRLGADRGPGECVLYNIHTPDRPAAIRTIQKALERVGANLGVILHPHRLRHTYACELLRSGVGIYDLALLLGHSDVSTTAIYLHVQPDDLAARVRAATPPTTYQLRLVA